MRTRNIASVQQNTLHRLWYKAAQRDRIRLRLLERLVFTIGIQSGGSSAWDGYVASITADALVKSQTSGVPEKVVTGGTPDFYKK